MIGGGEGLLLQALATIAVFCEARAYFFRGLPTVFTEASFSQS
jgi:hypothetical protein